MSPYSPSTEKGAKKAKRKSKENLSKMVNDKVRATMKQVMHLILVLPKKK